MIKVTCSVCGKEFEMEDKWASFVKNKPNEVKCFDCYKKKTSAQSKKAEAKTATPADVKVPECNASVFKKAYSELTAEFADCIDEVKEYLGGWTSTMVINQLQAQKFKK